MCDECTRSSPIRRTERFRASLDGQALAQYERELAQTERRKAEDERIRAEARAAGQRKREFDRAKAERAEQERADAERRKAEREEELALIAAAKAIEAERKHQADLAWAKRVLAADEPGVQTVGREHIPRAVRHAVWNRDHAECAECGSNEKLEFDHLIPVARGGSNSERNLQLLCESCNRRKGKSLG